MRRNPSKITALLLLGIFALFYCGNALFLHTHIIGDTTVVHSHPYLPSGHHSHSAQSLESITGFNSSLFAMQPADEACCTAPDLQCCDIATACTLRPAVSAAIRITAPRAPPAV